MIVRGRCSLSVSNVDVRLLAEEYDTPLYIYDEETLRSRCRSLSRAMSGFGLYYSLKANSNPYLLEIIREEGFGAEAVSPGEVVAALAVGWEPREILFTGNSLRLGEVTWALGIGVEVNVDSLGILEGICGEDAEIGLRINPLVGEGYHEYTVTGGLHAKFGIGLHELERAAELEERCRFRVKRLHAHIGSGIRDPRRYAETLRTLIDLAEKYFPEASEFDVGGGLYVPYRPGEEPIDVGELAALLREAAGTRPDTRIMLEPGRYLVAESGILLARVTDIKRTPDGLYIIGTDTGMNHLLRPALYDAYHEVVVVSERCGEEVRANVVGNICESSDVLARDRVLPLPRIGDLVAVLNAGAYGFSMASNYNLRALPAEIIVGAEGSHAVARSRQRPEQLVFNVPYFAERVERVLNRFGWPFKE